MRGVEAGEHLRSRTFSALVLSACAIASARLRHTGPLFFHSIKYTAVVPSEELSEAFHQAASEAIWLRRNVAYTLDELRAALNLNFTCIQKGCSTEMQFWLGAYATMSAVSRIFPSLLIARRGEQSGVLQSESSSLVGRTQS